MRTLFSQINKVILAHKNPQYNTAVKGKEMNQLPCIDNAWLLVENGLIADFGEMNTLNNPIQADEYIDCTGKMILPTWCDSHTHMVFAHTREHEFVDRIHGLTYEEIAKKGGGILNSAKKMQETDENFLFETALLRLIDLIRLGTGAIEIKSGYGLNTENELKMLRVIKKLKEQNLIDIKATFLGAHAYPAHYRENHQGYIDLITQEMLPQIAEEGLADYIDVFCEKGFFNVSETEQILEAGLQYGLKPKIHANQLYNSGGVQTGVKYNAISVDHLETIDDEEISCLQNSNTIATLLPGAAFFLAMHYQPARKMIDANIPIALASDYNPGSCPSGNMNFLFTLACTQMKMTPEECIHAMTINGAAAMELQHTLGSIYKGKKANFILTKKINNIAYMPYAFGENTIDTVYIKGKKV